MAAKATQRRGLELTEHILDAAYDFLLDQGYAELTIEGVAARAGVSKATIYTRWATKFSLITEATTRRIGYIDVPDLGSFEGEVTFLLTERLSLFGSAEATDLYSALLAAAAEDPESSQALADHTESMQRAVDPMIERGIARGELAEDIDVDALKNLLPAALAFRALLVRSPPSKEFAAHVSSIICRGAMKAGVEH